MSSIDPKKMADILPPSKKQNEPRPEAPLIIARRVSPVKIFFGAAASLAAVAVIFYGLKLYDLHSRVTERAPEVYGKLQKAVQDLKKLDAGGAWKNFSDVYESSSELNKLADDYGLTPLLKFGGGFLPALGAVPEAAKDFTALTGYSMEFSKKLDGFQKNAASLVFGGGGTKLMAMVSEMLNDAVAISKLSQNLADSAQKMGVALPENYLMSQSEFSRYKSLLESVLAFASQESSPHIALLFQNPSEIRPGGGFIGSYADITLKDGSVDGIDVRDIYDPDGQLPVKIIPPLPLQPITHIWGARDANWFFDFPASAEKVLSFLDASKIYSEQNIKFSGALAMNVNVIRDILNAVGPIDLPEYGLVITGENFLEEVQREVESGEDKKAGEPKRILKVLTPMLLDKLAHSEGETKVKLFGALRTGTLKKDVMLYSRDRGLQAYLLNAGLAGEIYSADDAASGDYLAVVNANIGGGKSDAFTARAVSLESFISADGKITDKLTVAQKHEGEERTEWWYKMKNINFLQILVPAGSGLSRMTGHDLKPQDKPILRPAYSIDPDVLSIEKTSEWLPEVSAYQFRQFGKTVFGAWATTPAGEESRVTAEYSLPERLEVKDGARYRFVYDKQSGVNAPFNYSVTAPEGYAWRESSTQKFEYKSDVPDRRIIIELSLKKE